MPAERADRQAIGERVGAGAAQPPQVHGGKRRGKQRRQGAARDLPAQLACLAEMVLGAIKNAQDDTRQRGREAPRQSIVHVEARVPHQIGRQIEAASRRMKGRGAHQTDHRERDTGMLDCPRDAVARFAQGLAPKVMEFRRRCLSKSFEGSQIRGRLGAEIRDARLNDPLEPLTRKETPLNDRSQGQDDWMVTCFAVIEFRDGFAPPLQPDLAQHGLTDGVRDPGNFHVEGGQCQQRRTHLARSEERTKVAVVIVGARFSNAMGGRFVHSI